MHQFRKSILRPKHEYLYEKLEFVIDLFLPTEKQGRVWPGLMLVSIALFFGISGYLTGYASHALREAYSSSSQITIDPTKMIFKYNDTFTLPPSKHTNKAWKDLFPVGEGFVLHPQLSPNTSGISVFHQLHCLDMLRLGCYQAHQSSSIDSEKSHKTQHEHAHTRHCFDYLRQSIMCAADATFEPVVLELGGITGWGVEHVCRDFEQLAAWAAEWRDEHPGELR